VAAVVGIPLTDEFGGVDVLRTQIVDAIAAVDGVECVRIRRAEGTAVEVLERLDGLFKKGFIEKRNFKPFYFAISETLKFYLAERFQFDAQESTTSELMTLLRERSNMPGLNEPIIGKIEKIFETLDPVKFANAIPSDDEARTVLREARDVVVTTRKQAEVRT